MVEKIVTVFPPLALIPLERHNMEIKELCTQIIKEINQGVSDFNETSDTHKAFFLDTNFHIETLEDGSYIYKTKCGCRVLEIFTKEVYDIEIGVRAMNFEDEEL